MFGQLVHVGVDLKDDGLARPSAQGPMHGVALVEAGAEYDQHVGRIVEDGGRCVARAGIAEYAERQFMVFREHALGAQRRRNGNRPALRDRHQRGGRVIVLDAGAGEKGDLRSFQQVQRSEGRGPAQGRSRCEIA